MAYLYNSIFIVYVWLLSRSLLFIHLHNCVCISWLNHFGYLVKHSSFVLFSVGRVVSINNTVCLPILFLCVFLFLNAGSLLWTVWDFVWLECFPVGFTLDIFYSPNICNSIRKRFGEEFFLGSSWFKCNTRGLSP